MEESRLSLHERLPIEGVLPDLKKTLAFNRNAVLVAEPGAVPLEGPQRVANRH